MKSYTAPWGKSLIAVSSLASVVCLAIAVGAMSSGHHALSWPVLAPVAIICVSGLFAIRSYSVAPDELLVHRLLWTTRLPLLGLESAAFEPDAMRRSIRTFGNGGLFSFSGFYRNRALGTYRAFVTDPCRTVVLHFPKGTVVVSPSTPEDFVQDVGTASHAASAR
jgi:hypothetical protein